MKKGRRSPRYNEPGAIWHADIHNTDPRIPMEFFAYRIHDSKRPLVETSPHKQVASSSIVDYVPSVNNGCCCSRKARNVIPCYIDIGELDVAYKLVVAYACFRPTHELHSLVAP